MTLGFGEIVRIFMNNLDRPVNITNGPKGITGIDPVHIGDFSLAQTHSLFGIQLPSVYMYYYLFVLCSLLVIWVCTRLQHSRIGRAWAAIREDEIAAKAMGINTRNVKLLAFAMGASFGGLSGAMFGSFQGFVSPESFTFWESIVVLACVVLGGMGHIPGVILGAVLLAIFPEFLRSTMALQHALFGHDIVDTEVIRQALYGLAMVVIMLYRSEGLGPRRSMRTRSRNWRSAPARSRCALNRRTRDTQRQTNPTVRAGREQTLRRPAGAVRCRSADQEGEIYGLIGPNGAGKTTFFNVITGLYTPDSGEFKLDGTEYKPTAVHQVAKTGIARTFQNIRLFGGMTALENVMVGRHVRTKHGLLGAVFQTPAERQEEREIKERAIELLEYVGVLQYADYTSRNLSYGHQRRLEIARALATDPKLLALDEPA